MERTESELTTAGLRWQMVLLSAISLSIGWGIRGNFGHEWGAAIPGALAAMAIAVLSNREDWQRRVAYFAAFGAMGWSFGGSISYMQVIGYTHSGHSLSVWYGFVCLFLIGFVWAAMGGAGTALPAFLSRERLAEFFAPTIAIFLAWWVEGAIEERFIDIHIKNRQESPLYWFDSDWMSALIAIVVVVVMALIRRRLDKASALILHIAVGWWVGFLLFPNLLGWRMTPPRGDDWAGCLGMVGGMLVFFQYNGLGGVTFVSLVTGFIGGLGFSTAQLFKLLEMTSGLQTNWHSILEQSYGFINGIGVGVAMGFVMNRSPRQSDDPPTHRWTEDFAISFLLILLTYLNLQKMVNDWAPKAMPETMYFLTARGWFDLAYFAIALTFLVLLREHRRQPLPFIPASWAGKGQMLYLTFLWWMIVGNFMKALPSFAPQRLVTEYVIFLNGLLATLMVSLWVRTTRRLVVYPLTDYRRRIRMTLQVGIVVSALATLLQWGVTRAVYGDKKAPGASLHIRFGPNSTATTEKPKPGVAHP